MVSPQTGKLGISQHHVPGTRSPRWVPAPSLNATSPTKRHGRLARPGERTCLGALTPVLCRHRGTKHGGGGLCPQPGSG